MNFQVYDIQFVNNYLCIHSRNVDESEPAHLLRLWLAHHEGRTQRDSFLEVYHGNINPRTACDGIPPFPSAQ